MFTNSRGFSERYDLDFELEDSRSETDQKAKGLHPPTRQGGRDGGGSNSNPDNKPPNRDKQQAESSKQTNFGAGGQHSDSMQTDEEVCDVEEHMEEIKMLEQEEKIIEQEEMGPDRTNAANKQLVMVLASPRLGTIDAILKLVAQVEKDTPIRGGDCDIIELNE